MPGSVAVPAEPMVAGIVAPSEMEPALPLRFQYWMILFQRGVHEEANGGEHFGFQKPKGIIAASVEEASDVETKAKKNKNTRRIENILSYYGLIFWWNLLSWPK